MAGKAGAIRAGKAFVEIFADSSKLVSGLRGAQAKLKAFGQQVSAIGRQMLTIGGAAAVPFVLSARTFAGFEDQMLTVKAVTGATEKQFESLTKQAAELGRTTSFTAAQVGSGMVALGRAGFTPDEIMAATPAMLNLARATGTDLSESAGIAADALRIFGLDASESGRAADVLTAAANGANHILPQLAEALAYAGPLAVEAGESIESTAKAAGVLANMGIKGSMAGTSLRMMFVKLADPGVQKTLEGLGVAALDAAGNMRPMGDVMIELGQAVAKLPNAQRLALFKELFDQRAMGAALKIGDPEQMKRLGEAIDNAAGSAARAAKTMDSGLGGAFRMLKSAVEGVAIAVGEAITGTLKDWMGAVQNAADMLARWVEKNQELVAGLAVLVAGLIATGAATLALGVAMKVLAVAVGIVTLALKVMGVVLAIVTMPITLIIVGCLAAAGAVLYMAGAFDGAGEAFSEFWGGIKAALASGDLSAAFNVITTGLSLLWVKMTGWLRMQWINFWAGVKSLTELALQGLYNAIASFAKGAAKVLNWATLGLAEELGLPTQKDFDDVAMLEDRAHKDRLANIEREAQVKEQAINAEVEAAREAYRLALEAAHAKKDAALTEEQAAARTKAVQAAGSYAGMGAAGGGRAVGTFNPAAIKGLLGPTESLIRVNKDQLAELKRIAMVLAGGITQAAGGVGVI